MKIFKQILLLFFLAASLLFSQHKNWTWVKPQPQGNRINAMWTFGKDTIILVGGAGTYMTSSNGGKDWEIKHYFQNSTV